MDETSISQTLLYPPSLQAQQQVNDNLNQKNLYFTTLLKGAEYQLFKLLTPEKSESRIDYLNRCFREHCASLSEEFIIGLTNGKSILDTLDSLEFENEEYDRLFENTYVLQFSTKQERILNLYNFLNDTEIEMLHPLFATSLLKHFYEASIHSISHYDGEMALEIANILWWHENPEYYMQEIHEEAKRYYKTKKITPEQLNAYIDEQGILTPEQFSEYIGKCNLEKKDLLSLEKLEELAVNSNVSEKLNIILQKITLISELDRELQAIGQQTNSLLRSLSNFYFQFFQNPFYIFEYGQPKINQYGQKKIGLIQETLEDLRNNQELYDDSATFSIILKSEHDHQEAKKALERFNQEVEAILTIGNILENWTKDT